ncbi:hypothetical protein ACLOJK_002484 [Asimina triloba]
MEVEHSTPDRKLTRSGNGIVFEKTPPQTLQTVQRSPIVGGAGLKNTAPHFITGSKAFNFTERYMSPTDRILSPISKGLLARNRKAGQLLPPSKTPPKIITGPNHMICIRRCDYLTRILNILCLSMFMERHWASG